MAIVVPNYSADVFFYPWVGPQYITGLNFNQAGNLIGSGLRVAVLGKEHFCEDDEKHNNKQVKDRNIDQQSYIQLLQQIQQQSSGYVRKQLDYLLADAQAHAHCLMHTNGCEDCGHVTVCHHKTKEFIESLFISEKPHQSVINFRQFWNNNMTVDIWNHLLYANFFQRGMPYSDTGKNVNFQGGVEPERGAKALAEIVRIHTPHILISWGKENTHMKILFEHPEILEKKGLSLRLMPKDNRVNYQIPRIHVADYDNERTIPFSIVDVRSDKSEIEHSCLFLFFPHPTYQGKPQYEKFRTILRCTFRYYNELIQWNPDKNGQNLSYRPITCEFDAQLNWNVQNYQQFQLCK